MSGLSVVIPSKTVSNLIPCVNAVLRHERSARIIVMDDGLVWPPEQPEPDNIENLVFLPGSKPFIFSRNVNLAVRAAGNDDVCVTNDDAILQTPAGFTAMQKEAAEHPEYGIISATTNLAGNRDQQPKGIGLRDAGATAVAFICVLIPRRTIDLVGPMDERFGGTTADGRVIYGFCDSDLCRRVRNAGLKVGIFDGCYVDHSSLRSTFRGDPRAAGDLRASGELYLEKWGDLA